ncbi:uncharacterized protein Boot [Drosophila takahashii]|uniref:uncharacterized protein Boot n=1 Tax=Drosophila takahashii TaxID=29030 RepID=UPI001CF8BB5A|nr:uncharacterized protein LOC108061982 [Drosophila takahashii]
MTNFNASGAMMPLDEYYEHCVVPKPKVPRPYTSMPMTNRTKRQAGRLRSYKELGPEDEDDDEDDDLQGSELDKGYQEDGAIDSNLSQMSFEMNDFNKMYWEEESLNQEVSQTSAQWRIYGNNVNRPAGAAPLVPNDQARGNVKSRLDLRDGSRFRNANNQRRNQNSNNHRRHHQAQDAREQRLRTAYNAFSSETNHARQPGDVLMNIHNHFQYDYQGPNDPHASANMMGPDHYDTTNASSITSLIDSVSHIPDNRVKNRLGCEFLRSPNTSNDMFAGRAQGSHFQEMSTATTTSDLEEENYSKMAHNVLLFLKSAAQNEALGNSS